MTARTSATDPLRIDEIVCQPWATGIVGITFCPGKSGDSVFGSPWQRDLDLDLDAVAAWGAAVALTLVEEHELRLLQVPALGEGFRKRGIEWHHLPIVDLSTPDQAFHRLWRSSGDAALRTLREGKKVLVHCRGGRGRAGTVAAALLIELGETPQRALKGSRCAAWRGGDACAGTLSGHVHAVAGAEGGRLMDWFERITGFAELPYAETQQKLSVEEGRLHSQQTDRTWAVGQLETPSLAELRHRVEQLPLRTGGKTRVSCVQADVRRLHADPVSRGALFQVASQFNLLEMVGPNVTPEHGVSRYANDLTQGPACAIAAGAGTIFRNYLVEVDGQTGQRDAKQIDCLKDVGRALGNVDGSLWQMRNGYALCTGSALAAIDARLRDMTVDQVNALRGQLRIGLQWNVEVTDSDDPKQLISQAYCSALPVNYTSVPRPKWQGFATLVLEATYEATLLAGLLNALSGGCRTAYLTRVGGGAFGNDLAWINHAIERSVRLVQHFDLDIRLVCHGAIPADLQALAEKLNA